MTSGASIAVQISYKRENTNYSVLLDTIDDVHVELSSTVTEHPIVNGDTIADHMYNNPLTMTISGTFSLNGGQAIVISSGGAKLANIQSMFETIKDEAIMCDIVKLTVNLGDKGIRFAKRTSMVLTSISWTEKINSLGFSFGFTQALVAEVQTYDVDTDDSYLPNVSEPATLNFTDALLDWTYIDELVVSTAVEVGLVKENFWNFMQSLGADALVSLGVATPALAVTLVAIIAGAAAIPVAGWVVAVGAAIVSAAVFIVGLVKSISSAVEANQYKVKQFEYYKDDRKNQEEVERFTNFIGGIHTQLSALNDSIQCWQIGSNEEQEAMISISNNYYIFTFTKNNASKSTSWNLSVTDVNGSTVGGISNVSSAPTSFSDCTTNGKLFRAAESGAYVYLIRVEDKDASDLTNYFIVATTLKPENFNDTVTEIIKNAMLR